MNIDFESILKSYEDYSISYEEIVDAENRTAYNVIVSEYLFRLHEEYSKWNYLSESQRLFDCSKKWLIDNYPKFNISDVRFVSHCRSKWCLHCQKLRQASRLARFEPLLTETAERYDLYHIVLTVPNVPGVKLKAICKKVLPQAFKRLVRIFRSKDKIKGLDMSRYGFHAALRSMEITYKDKYLKDVSVVTSYHPHLHCIFALKKGLDFEKVHENDFSYDYGTLKTLYSDFEIMLQKLWRLIVDSELDAAYNPVAMTDALGDPLPKSHPNYGKFVEKPKKKNKKDGAVTLKALNALEQGYSCKADLIEHDEEDNRKDFLEVFKYACKCTSEDARLFIYEQFKWLYFALENVHVMQGYGAWARVKCDEEDESLGEFYKIFISYLRQRDIPIPQVLNLADVKKHIEDKSMIFITRKCIKQWLKRSDEAVRQAAETAFEGVKPAELKPRYFSANFTTAYYRFLKCRNDSPLFADIREREEKSRQEKQLLVLSSEQMSFLDSIF